MNAVNSVVPVYFDWRTREFKSIGSTNAAATVTAQSVIMPQLADINPSSSIEWTLWPTTSNNSPQAVEDIGFFWWDSKNARYIRTDTLEGYTDGLTSPLKNQGWQVDANAFNLSNIGRANVQRLQYYDGSQSTPYAFHGNYRALAETLILDAAEWQALFAGGGDVELPGLGLKVIQYGNGVKVVEAADGTYTVVSDAAGGILDIVPIGDVRQVFGTLGDLTLDDLAIFEASQRQTSPLFGLLETDADGEPVGVGPISPPPEKSPEATNDLQNLADPRANNNTPAPATIGGRGGKSTVGAGSVPALPQAQASSAAGAAAPLTQVSRDPIPILDTPLEPLDTGQNNQALQPQSLASTVQKKNQSLSVILADIYRDNGEVAPQRVPYILRGESMSITDDPSSESEDRKKNKQTYLSYSDKKQAQDDMLKREAASGNANVRRLRAMQLREYLNL